MTKRDQEEKIRSLAQSLKEEVGASEGLKDHLIKRISSIASSERKGREPIYLYLTSRPAIATVMASAALILIFCLPLFLQINFQKDAADSPVVDLKPDKSAPYQKTEIFEPLLKINAKKTDSSIILSWEGSEKNVYKVTRSTSPKDFSNAHTVMVAGNQWVDPLKNGSPIIFYKIE